MKKTKKKPQVRKKKMRSMFGSNPKLPPFEEKDRFEAREYP